MNPPLTKLIVFGIAYASAYFWAVSITKLRLWNELHHWVYGAAALTVAYNITDTPPLWIIVPSLALMIDDAFQHVRQLDEPTYMSPAHRLYGKVWTFCYKKFGWTLP